MKVIWKYPLAQSGTQRIQIPQEGRILAVQTQHDEPCLWVEVNTSKQRETRTFKCFETGHSLGSNPGYYLGTLQLYSGSLVLHVYEQRRPL